MLTHWGAPLMTDEELKELARGNVERHLGDVCDEEMTPDRIHNEVYTLAIDALVSAGVDLPVAHRIAQSLAMDYAQP